MKVHLCQLLLEWYSDLELSRTVTLQQGGGCAAFAVLPGKGCFSGQEARGLAGIIGTYTLAPAFNLQGLSFTTGEVSHE